MLTPNENNGGQILGDSIVDNTFEHLEAPLGLLVVDSGDQSCAAHVNLDENVVPLVPVEAFAHGERCRSLAEHVNHL